MSKKQFDVARLVSDMGGAVVVAEITGKPRTAPYRWIAQGHISTRIIEMLKTHDPEIDINNYLI